MQNKGTQGYQKDNLCAWKVYKQNLTRASEDAFLFLFPVPDPGSPSLTFRTAALMHIRSVCSIHIAAIGTFSFVSILTVISPRHSAMATTLLTVSIEVSNFYGITTPIMPFNRFVNVIHIFFLPSIPLYIPHSLPACQGFLNGNSSISLTFMDNKVT